jgi:outer membrane murein-binding lipoprotein Lpp
MKSFLPWFMSAVLLATVLTECGSARLAAADASNVDTLRTENAALQEENARLRWQAAYAAQQQAYTGG